MSGEIFDGDTLEAALEKAATKLGTEEEEELEYELLDEGKKDFWGLDEGFVRIRAWLAGQRDGGAEPWVEEVTDVEEAEEPEEAEDVEDDEEDDEQVAPELTADRQAGEPTEVAEEPESLAEPPLPAEPSEPLVVRTEEERIVERDVEPLEDAEEAVEELLERILHEMDFDCGTEVEEQADAYLALISGDDKEYLLEGNGRSLSALELILNHAFRHRLAEGKKVRVDAGDFRSRRDEELRDLAFQVAHSAKESGSTQETQSLNPYERRLVHLALAEDEGVTTRSRGSGFLKNVQVIPRRGRTRAR